jgi:hypothetical protein
MAEQLIYPQAYLAMGNGDLVDVTNFKMTLTNGAKQVHTLRKKGAGIQFGVEESTVTFDSVISENGPERNYWRLAKKGLINQIRAKLPGGVSVLTVNGAFSTVDFDGPLDAATKVSCTFVGRMEEPET